MAYIFGGEQELDLGSALGILNRELALGLGRIILAVLLAEAWQPLGRRDYHALRCLSGVAPVTPPQW